MEQCKEALLVLQTQRATYIEAKPEPKRTSHPRFIPLLLTSNVRAPA
jgi:hypothetical protein